MGKNYNQFVYNKLIFTFLNPLILLCIILFFVTSCKKDNKDEYRGQNGITVSSSIYVSSLTSHSAVAYVSIDFFDKKIPIKTIGICWNTEPYPIIANRFARNMNDSTTFSLKMGNLMPNTKYFVRIYITNDFGTLYFHSDYIFTTKVNGGWLNPQLSYGNLTDREGNNHATIAIGNQVWMAENLCATTYANGDTVANITDASLWSTSTIGAWACLDNDIQYNKPFGILYNWYAASDSRNICPDGWHVPDDTEWFELVNYLGGSQKAIPKIKSVGNYYWGNHNDSSTNITGFSCLPNGVRYENGRFEGFGSNALFWTKTEHNEDYGTDWLHFSDLNILSSAPHSKKRGFAIRCIKD